MFASLMSGIMLFQTAAMMPVSTASAAGACTVNTNKTYQSIRGFGGMNLPEWQSYDLTDAQIQTCFGNGAGQLGLSVLRIYVSDDSSAWSRAIPTAKGAQKLGATVFATPWNPPAAIRNTVNGGNSGGKYQLKKDKWADYAQHLNKFVKYVEGQGVNLYAVSIQNEPDYAADWTYWSANDLASFAAQYGAAIKNGTNAKLMSPESFQYRKDLYNPIMNNQQAKNNIDLFGTHFYGTQRSQMDFPTLENSGKEIWMTEVYVPNSNSNSANNWPEAISVAENIHNGLVVGNMSAYVWWYIRRSYSLIGQDDGKPTKRGYMMAQYSKWVRPGDVRIDATEQPNTNVLCSAFKHSDKQITIVAVNKGTSEVSQQFTVSGRNITNVDRYRTTGSENLAETKNLTAQGSSFSAQLPGNSVSTFVVTMDSDGVAVPENPNEPVVVEPLKPDANGYYFHDTFENGTDEWEGRGSAAVAKGGTAYQGSGALSISGREKAWHGAQKTLQYATFEGGKEYSFSANVYSAAAQKVMLSLQYTDAAGETKYDHIADAETQGGYVQLANPNYKIPDGASSPILYIETEEGTGELFLDEVIGAVAGTKIEGAKAQPKAGDLNEDGKLNSNDISLMLKYILTSSDQVSARADMNGDKVINSADLTLLKRQIQDPAKTEQQTNTQPEQQNNNNNQTEKQSPDTQNNNNNNNQQPQVQLKPGQWDYSSADVSWINGKKTVAISFDDGPVTGNTATRIHNALTKQGFHATFFYWGNKINSGNENEIREAEKRGFEVANHTWTHPYLTQKDNNTIASEYNQTKDKLNSILGVNRDYLVRPPYLAVNDNVKNIIPTPLINCGIDSGDWNNATTQQIVSKIQQAANDGSLNGQVVLMHETYDTTATAVEQLCPWLAEHGYAIVTVSEMFKYNNKEMFKGNVYNKC